MKKIFSAFIIAVGCMFMAMPVSLLVRWLKLRFLL